VPRNLVIYDEVVHTLRNTAAEEGHNIQNQTLSQTSSRFQYVNVGVIIRNDDL
jgi:hypothetical protein